MRVLLRDLFRQRLRTGLTTLGVGLGIFTLVVLGALGEHFRALVEEAKAYTAGQLRLYTKTNKQGINPGITEEAISKARAIEGVKLVRPTLTLYLDGFDLEDDPLSFMIPKPLVEGVPAAYAEAIRGNGVKLIQGRWLAKGDVKQAMVIDWLAYRRQLTIGSTVTIRHQPYEVVGIYHAPDTPMIPAGFVPYAVLNATLQQPEVERTQVFFRRLLAENAWMATVAAQAPPGAIDELARRFALEQGNMFRIYEVVPDDRSPEQVRVVAKRLRAALPELAVIDPDRIEERMEQTVAIFLVITLIVTVLSTIVGGLLIVNTMAMAVIERRREIAIKAAVGATPGQIATQFVAEAALLAGCGALAGLGLGVFTIWVFEPYLLGELATGARLFLVTPRLAILAVVYALVMGILAGGLPALRASRIDPAIALREL